MATEPADIGIPKARRPNELLARHGRAGWLIVRLQRYAMMGWMAFFTLLAVFVLLVFVSTLTPQPIVAVDESGRITGKIEWLDARSRTDKEFMGAAKHFADRYLSLNSNTIFEDYAEAMNMMGGALYESSMNLVKAGYLARIQKADSRSRLVLAEKEGIVLTQRRDHTATVRLRGELEVAAGSTKKDQSFDLTLTMTAIARTPRTPQGVRIEEIKEN